MSQIQHILLLKGRKIELIFREIALPHAKKYFITGTENGQALMPLEARFDYDRWKPMLPVPDWAMGIESSIIGLIR